MKIIHIDWEKKFSIALFLFNYQIQLTVFKLNAYRNPKKSVNWSNESKTKFLNRKMVSRVEKNWTFFRR